MGSAQSKRARINYLDPSRDEELLLAAAKRKARRDASGNGSRNMTHVDKAGTRLYDSSACVGEQTACSAERSKSCADIDLPDVTVGSTWQSRRRLGPDNRRSDSPACPEQENPRSPKQPSVVTSSSLPGQHIPRQNMPTRRWTASECQTTYVPVLTDSTLVRTSPKRFEDILSQEQEATQTSLDTDQKSQTNTRISYKETCPYNISSSIETSSSSGDGSPPRRRSHSAPKFAPVDPKKLLLFVGQDIESVADYANNMEGGSNVAGVTTYTALSDVAGASLLGLCPGIAKCPIDYGAGVVDATALLRSHPHAALNLGLDITKTKLSGITRGAHDENLYQLGKFMRGISPRPVYLRIGYECDGPWNNYNPKTFPAAFAYIVEFLRNERVENFVSVWQVSASKYSNTQIKKYWPGENVVDWIGCSHFDFHPPSFKALVAIARANNLPVLICEAAPQGYDIPRGRRGAITGDGSDAKRVGTDAVWNAWFKPFFKLVHENRDIIRGISYINCNWESQKMWNTHEQGYWGNTVLTSTNALKVKRRWEAEVNDTNFWLQANKDMWTKELHP